METDNPFEKVLDRLREKGWAKGRGGDSHGPNCIIGALGRELSTSLTKIAESFLAPVILDQYPGQLTKRGSRILVRFNDHPDTTFTDVERVLEKAAVKWEEERVMRDE